MMKVGIIGVGAMGSLFGAYLSPWAQVTLLGHWPEQLAALQQGGLTLEGVDGRSTHHTLQATNNPSDIAPVDLALALVKSYQTSQAAHSVKQILKPNGLALTLQNGLGNLEQLTAVLPPHQIALGSTSQGATMLEPGQVRHAGQGTTYLARTPETAVRLAAVARLFNQAGLSVSLVDNVNSLVWGKLVVNSGINPLTALLGVPNGFLAKNGQARKIMMATAAETASVAQALNIVLPYPDAAQRTLEVAQATAANYSSMLQDTLRGAPTEIEAICGAVVKNGRRTGAPTPINQKLHELVKALENHNQRLMIKDLSTHFNL